MLRYIALFFAVIWSIMSVLHLFMGNIGFFAFDALFAAAGWFAYSKAAGKRTPPAQSGPTPQESE